MWCSQRDIARAIVGCVDAHEDVHFDIVFATSNNRWGYRDLTHAEAVIGFVPQDAAEDHR